ncbi:DEAD/DEAH box helicase family protein [Pseudomonas sp. WS 5011]|uniref:DEAD/DEAH box helicase family protein n=1 Tax=Pseudomonas sp. WS 5011 TaxID=2717477 RepID=UPI0031F6D8A8
MLHSKPVNFLRSPASVGREERIQQIHSDRSSALTKRVPADFFDLIIVDEAHHAPATSWRQTLAHFSKAKKIFVTGTPFRGDKQMCGESNPPLLGLTCVPTAQARGTPY